MNGLISLENISLRPVSKEILALNEISGNYGLVLTEEDARELSEMRNKAIVERGDGGEWCGVAVVVGVHKILCDVENRPNQEPDGGENCQDEEQCFEDLFDDFHVGFLSLHL